jgi:hypothetical protein
MRHRRAAFAQGPRTQGPAPPVQKEVLAVGTRERDPVIPDIPTFMRPFRLPNPFTLVRLLPPHRNPRPVPAGVRPSRRGHRRGTTARPLAGSDRAVPVPAQRFFILTPLLLRAKLPPRSVGARAGPEPENTDAGGPGRDVWTGR